MAEVKLLGSSISPFSYRVEWALKYKDIKYELIQQDLQNKSALLLESNPLYKKVPVLLHGGNPIAESLVIFEYLDDTWKENPLLPHDPYQRASARLWAKFIEEKCTEICRTAFYTVGKEQEKAIESLLESLRLVDRELNGKKFFGGESIGFTDLVLGWIPRWLPVIEEAGEFKVLNSQDFPSLCAWCESFVEVPIIKENLPSHQELVPYFLATRKSILSLASK